MSRTIYPRPIGYEEVHLRWMVGRRVSEVSFFEPTLWRFFLGSDSHVGVECLWRVIKSKRVLLTSGDHGQKFGLPAPIDAARNAAECLLGADILAVQLREATADIVIDLAGELRLEVIPDSSGYEAWSIYAPGGVCFVAQGGGQLCTWMEDA